MEQIASSLGISSEYKALPYYEPVGPFSWKIGAVKYEVLWYSSFTYQPDYVAMDYAVSV